MRFAACRRERRWKRPEAVAVAVAPKAIELVHALTVAVDQRLTVDQLAGTVTVIPRCQGR